MKVTSARISRTEKEISWKHRPRRHRQPDLSATRTVTCEPLRAAVERGNRIPHALPTPDCYSQTHSIPPPDLTLQPIQQSQPKRGGRVD